jgi:hypothetical protein
MTNLQIQQHRIPGESALNDPGVSSGIEKETLDDVGASFGGVFREKSYKQLFEVHHVVNRVHWWQAGPASQRL